MYPWFACDKGKHYPVPHGGPAHRAEGDYGNTILKTVLWCLAVFCGLLLASAVAVPFVIDEEARKDAISAELEEHLDARVDITGDVSVSLLPRPKLKLRDVRIRPAEERSAPTSFMQIAEAELDISLSALLSGDPAFERVHLRTPRLSLASPGEDALNRVLTLAGEWMRKLEGLRPLHLEISGGEALFLGSQEERRRLADSVALTVRVPESGTPLRFEGRGRLRERMHSFSLAVGQSSAEQRRAFDLSWSSAEYGEAQARLQGEILLSGDERQLSGQLTAEIEDLEQVFANPPEQVQALPSSLEAELSSNFEELQADIGQLRLGDMDASGELQVRFARIPAFDLRLDMPQLDLASWLARLNGRGQSLLQGILDRQLDGRLRLRADSARFMGDLIQDLRLDATLAPGAALVERLEASAPGGSSLQLTGTLSPGAQALEFEGNLEGQTGNLRDFLTWLDMEIGHIPGERLRHADVTTAFQYSRDLLQFTGLELDLDVSRLTGGLAIALRERPGLGLGLEIDRLNLDGYLPRDNAGPAEKAERLRQDLAALGALLNRFDANLDLHAGRLTYLGERLSDLKLSGQLQGGELSLEQLRIGNLAGLDASLSGRLDNLAEVPRLSDTQFELELSRPEQLAETFDLPFPNYFGRLGALTANGILDGPLNDLSINSDMALGEASLFFSAQLFGGEEGNALSNGKLDLSGLTGRQLGDWLDLAADNSVRQLPELHVASNFSLEEGLWEYDTRLESESASLHLEGTTEDIDIGYPVTTFRFEFMHPESAVVLPRLLERSDEQLPRIEARGQAEASPRAIEVEESELSLNGDSLELGGELIFSGRRPEINLALQGDRLDLASLQAFLPPADTAEPENSEWPDAPLPLGFLRDYQGRLDVNLQRLETSWQPLESLRLSAGVTDNRLQFEELSAEVLDGRFSATGSLLADSTGNYDVELEGDLAEVSASSLSSSLFGDTRLAGRFDLPFSLSTDGESITRMLRNLGGSAALSGRLRLPAGDQEAEMPTGIGETSPNTLFALLDYPAEATGNLQIESGRVTSQDLQLSGPKRQLLLRGLLADLPRRQIRATAELFEENEDTPEAIMDIIGPLGEPAFRWQRFGRSLSQSSPQNARVLEQTERPAAQ